MDRQIIEISNNGFFLSLYRGFLVIENEKIFAVNDSRAIYGTLVNVTSNKAANRLFQTIAKKFMEEYCSA